MAEAIAQDNSRDLWQELNKLKPRCKIVPPHIDGFTDNQSVCQVFAKKYEELFNSVPSDNYAIVDMKSRMFDQISSLSSVPRVTIGQVTESVQRLKVNKKRW